MNCSKKLAVAILASCVSVFATGSASAQNPGFELGNLFLGFQTSGSSNYVMANIGDSAAYRDTTSNQVNLAGGSSLNSALISEFGANWFERTDLFVGVGASWSADEFGEPERNGDPYQTSYIGIPRQGTGAAGAAGSFAPSLTGQQVFDASTALYITGDAFERIGTGAVSTISKSVAVSGVDYDDQNPISAGVPQNAYLGVFSGGVQKPFATGSLAFGGINAEALLDLYRIDSATGVGAYEGTIALDSLGNVSFIVAPVPEPSTALGLGLLVGLVGLVKRRRTVVA